MVKNAKFQFKKVQLNEIQFKNGFLMRAYNRESFKEKKNI